MFAYPCGGEHGTSGLTFVLFTIGAAVLWTQRRRVQLLTLLAPFGVALAAAAVKRYPYGGVADGSPARVMQFLVPGICLLAGQGAVSLLRLIHDQGRQMRLFRVGLFSLVAIGSIPLVAESFHPYRTVHAHKAREFARRFWPEFVCGAEPVCLRWDVGLDEWESPNLNTAVYLCNQTHLLPPALAAKGSRVAIHLQGPPAALRSAPDRPR